MPSQDYFKVGDIVLFGRWKNKKGLVTKLYLDARGVPMVEIEPIPKGRKKNKTFSLFKIWPTPGLTPESTTVMSSRVAAKYLQAAIPHNVASKYAASQRYARLLLSMSMSEAKVILGFPPSANPSPEEITKAYKTKAFENHPDRGGDSAKMVEVNVAKDILIGRGPATREPSPEPVRRPRPEAAKPDFVKEGQSFEDALSSSGAPTGVEWKFVSVAEYWWEQSFYPSHAVWVLYGQTDTKHVFLGLKKLAESAGVIPTEKGQTKIMEDWQSSEISLPISQNIAKIAAKYIKDIGTTWADGAKPKAPRKFLAWPGGKPTKQTLGKIPRGGGAALKDILVGTGLLNDEDPSVSGRKSVVEIFTKYSTEKYNKYKKLLQEGKIKGVYRIHQYDFFVRVNGKTEQLTDDTVEKLQRSFIPFVMNNEISEGRAKNLTRMRSSTWLAGPGDALRLLTDCLTGEPSWLHIALEKAMEEWMDPVAKKTARLVAARFLKASK